MPANRSGKRARVPWKPTTAREQGTTLPVFMAYCGIAAALRPWNRVDRRVIVTLEAYDDYYHPVYAQAAQAFVAEIWKSAQWEAHVFEWSAKSFRDQLAAERNQRGIFFSPPGYRLTDDDRLFSDAVITLEPRSRRQTQVALRRAGLPADDRTVDFLISEPWPRLCKAFQDRRHPLQALERLQRRSIGKPISKEAKLRIDEQTGPTLADMHGFGPALEWGNNLAKDLADYKAGLISWNDVDTGVLISGPPGIGKTMFAGALANTCQVPIVFGSVSKWQEAGALDDHLKAMRASFAEAQVKAPSILFIDEVDTFGDRTQPDQNSGYFRGVIAAILELLDGFVRREGVIVVAACNHPKQVDAAIRRAGRLDRHLEIGHPDGRSRLSILKFHSGVELEGDHADKFDFATDGFSGAEIAQLVRDAKRLARRRSERLCADHLIEQLPPLTTLPEDYLRSFAVHEAGHALVGVELGHGQISNIKISSFRADGLRRELGYVEYEKAEPRSRTRATYLNTIALLLAGIAAEMEVFGSFADGSSGSSTADLNRATDIATAVEGALGMGHTLIVEALDQEQLAKMRLYNSELRERVHRLLQNELERARSIIQTQRLALDALVGRLMATGALSGDEAVQILESNRSSTVSLAKPQLGAATR